MHSGVGPNDMRGSETRAAARHEATLCIRAAYRLIRDPEQWPDIEREDLDAASEMLGRASTFLTHADL